MINIFLVDVAVNQFRVNAPIPDPPEAATRGVIQEKLFLSNFKNSKENTCARVSFLIKLKKDSGTGVFLWILPNF